MPTDEAEHLADELELALEHDVRGELRRDAVPAALLRAPTLPELLGMAAQEWLMILLAWVALWLSPWLWLPAVLVLAGRYHALGVILHDAAHMSLRGKPPAARLLELLCGFPLATTLDAMRYHHLRHHRDSGMPSDPYFKANVRGLRYAVQVGRGLLLVPFWSVRPLVGLVSLASPPLRQLYARAWLQDRSGQDVRHSREVRNCARAELGQLLAWVPLLAAAWAFPLAFVLAYAIPITLSGLLAAWRLLQEHRYEATHDRSVQTLLDTTRDHHLGLLGQALLAPRNIGFHVVHHLHPQLALAELPAVRAWYRAHWATVYPEPDR